MTETFYWHDYETWGATPRQDRAAQFAGLRTDLDFNPIGDPLVIYARPADDLLPQPGACLVTGLSPQECLDKGVPEAEFFGAIEQELARPGTCALGYNTLRFDDEVTRYGFYRNFIDPYAREWRNGNSRWDLIDVVRLTRALRPEGMEWPTHDDGVTSFRLEQLTAANGIAHEGAHDALSDVRATIDLARLLKDRQPKLFDYVFHNRDKRTLGDILDPAKLRPVLHVSSRYPARVGCIAAVLPLARHPVNKNGVVVCDLRADPSPLLELSAEEIRERLYTPHDQLGEGEQPIPIKLVHLNKAPVIVPMNTLTDEARSEWQMDAAAEQEHLQALLAADGLAAKLQAVYEGDGGFEPATDPDQMLYDGFIGDADRRLSDRVRRMSPEELAGTRLAFQDPRLPELLFRYRARNWPESLTAGERQQWESWRRARLTDPAAGASMVLSDYRKELAKLAIDPGLDERQRQAVDALLDWPEVLGL